MGSKIPMSTMTMKTVMRFLASKLGCVWKTLEKRELLMRWYLRWQQMRMLYAFNLVMLKTTLPMQLFDFMVDLHRAWTAPGALHLWACISVSTQVWIVTFRNLIPGLSGRDTP